MFDISMIKNIIKNEKIYNQTLAIIKNMSCVDFIYKSRNFIECGGYYKLSEEEKARFLGLIHKFGAAFAGHMIDLDARSVNSLIKLAKLEKYTMRTYNGVRVPTVNEIKLGSIGLEKEDIYPIGKDKHDLLLVLHWLVSGLLSGYSGAGYRYNYKSGVGLEDNIWVMLKRVEGVVLDICRWCESGLEGDIKCLRGYKLSGSVYLNFAKDEVIPEESIKKVIFELERLLVNNWGSNKNKQALYLINKFKKLSKLSPYEMVQLRELLASINSGDVRINDLRSKCEKVLSNKDILIRNRKAFVFNIIETLKSKNYNWCSEKQMAIIDDAIDFIENINEDVNSEVAVSINNMYDSLGDGDFGIC